MTPLLKQALAEVKKLAEPEQDAIASLILDELFSHRCREETAIYPIPTMTVEVPDDPNG